MKKHRHYTRRRDKRGIMNQKVIIGGLVVIITVLVLLTLLLGQGGNILSRIFPEATPTPTPAQAVQQIRPSPTPIDGASIIFTGLRFTPNTTELRLGQVVNIANLGDNPIEIATNNTTDEGRKLNLGQVESGGTSVFVEFRQAGVYEYFDKLNPENTGRIIVREN